MPRILGILGDDVKRAPSRGAAIFVENRRCVHDA
jgi:hypothetical protein